MIRFCSFSAYSFIDFDIYSNKLFLLSDLSDLNNAFGKEDFFTCSDKLYFCDKVRS